jgi:hypothetical protein
MRALPLLLSLLIACSGKNDDTSGSDGTDGTDATDGTDGSDGSADCVEENGACILEGAITESVTLTADKPWLLRSAVTVGDDSSAVTLTIEPGTTIYGESATNGFLVVTRGAKIMAEGSASAPIRFTSDQPVGSRARGDWGGLVLNGKAPINACADGASPCEAEGEGGTGVYGGDDPTDNSGVLKYVVIEFGGTEISPDNEINGLGLQGVGSGTTIDYIQVHRNLDDGIEFFGGNVGVKHLLITQPGDDGIDWDLGFQGKIQFAAVIQAGDAGNHGMETDSNADNHTATPASAPTISNLTLVGSTAVAEDNFGLVLRRGSQPTIHSLAAMDFSVGCLAIRDQATFDAFASGAASINSSYLACASPFEVDAEETEVGTEEDVFGMDSSNETGASLGLTDPSNATAPNLVPTGSSPLLGAGTTPSDSWFTAADHIGAFDAGGDWTAGWTTFAAN